MCFVEYISYYCGHSTVPVHRICPMTTHKHSNPVCPNPVQRPTEVSFMCPACTRILHGRWVEIIMYEHRWMHERGTCGCPVQFPGLQQPRMVGKDVGNPSTHEINRDNLKLQQKRQPQIVVSDVTNGTSQEANKGGLQNFGSISMLTTSGDGTRYSPAEGKKPAPQPHVISWGSLPPILEVKEDASDTYKPQINMRLASQYGIEWMPDHYELHESGKCHCPVRFETYQPHDLPEAFELSKMEDQADSDTGAPSIQMPQTVIPKEKVRYMDVVIWTVNENTPEGERKIPWPQRPEDYGFRSVAEARVCLGMQLGRQDPINSLPVYGGSSRGGDIPAAVDDAVRESIEWDIEIAGGDLRPHGLTSVRLSQHGDPIVGWPIGAGPEGGIENSHASSWYSCGISRPKLRRSKSWT
ncbi:uncharacterized protein BCR38DRAFT_413872 [Pseudomassariella vexata]|uniref:Uncharacterized protein n=1 Tax=Pseudomassariella vexata TaxID=1141098 RepID=A0A1Y2DFK9_9PEZI|nr:uncharacterized protein BCR38DRAFT_413872 [Pseudomassariella vexata]ORY57475.1 hypothetical protein BCR38DRAFT_413872 [Pseudomassariella vexata]